MSPSRRPRPSGTFDLIFWIVILSVWLVTGVWALVGGDGWKLSLAVVWVCTSGVWLGRILWSRRRDPRGAAAGSSPQLELSRSSDQPRPPRPPQEGAQPP